MKQVRTEDAVGMVLCHDITKIVPGEFKGARFKKGHVITAVDIPELLRLGKDHIGILELSDGQVHENDAATRLAEIIQGEGLAVTEPREGKVNLIAQHDGLCIIDEKALMEINAIEQIIVATRSNFRPVRKGDIIAGMRVVPLVIREEKLKQAERIKRCGGIVSVKQYRSFKVGIVNTGNEIFYKRIEDKFSPKVIEKMESYGCEIIKQIVVPDEADKISDVIKTMIAEGAEMILTTGGMSVDPDDVTPSGIAKTGAEIITYGAPVLPGAMLLAAYLGTVPVFGLPGCVMYNNITAFDLLLPIVLTGQRIDRSLITRLGMGGLCLQCDVCRYPDCSFGT